MWGRLLHRPPHQHACVATRHVLVVLLGFWLNPDVLQELYCEVLAEQCFGIHSHWVAPTGHAPYTHGTKPGATLPCGSKRRHWDPKHVIKGPNGWDPLVEHVQHIVTNQAKPQCYLNNSKIQGQQQLPRACTQTQD